MKCLMDLYHSGRWRANNDTFKSDYLKFLVKGMMEKKLEMIIKASPHIDSHLGFSKNRHILFLSCSMPVDLDGMTRRSASFVRNLFFMIGLR